MTRDLRGFFILCSLQSRKQDPLLAAQKGASYFTNFFLNPSKKKSDQQVFEINGFFIKTLSMISICMFSDYAHPIKIIAALKTKLNSILASTIIVKKMINSLIRKFLKGFFTILTTYIHCQEYESIRAYESSEFGQIMVSMLDENNLEVISDYRNYECECDVVEFTFTKNIDDNNFYTKDKSMSLYFLDDDIIIKNKKSDICCQLGTGLYEPYINHRWDEENDLSEETEADINSSLNFLNGFWKDNYNAGQMPYELQYSEPENTLNIVNEDGEVVVSLSQVSSCGFHDKVFTIIMTSGENCWYIDDISSDLVHIWTYGETELYKQYELEKISD